MHKLGAVRCLLIIALCMPGWVCATELYRYTNDKGVVVLDRQGVPAQYIGKGYEVLNDQGRVVQVVPPAPSPEEMQRILAERARAKTDAQLLRLYSTVEDVERAKERKLNELDGVIGVARGNLQSLRSQQANLQNQAADHERAGRAVPEHLLTQIDNLKGEQASVQKDIARFQQNRKDAEASFTADQVRIGELIGVQP
ncbi:MAG: DUF4124 domain-containing protein [Pseudomonadota bacterium]